MHNKEHTKPSAQAEQMAVQMRKGFLAYCTLLICAKAPVYSSDIIKQLFQAKLVVVEGTIYPLLSRLQKEGLLEHTWEESQQGPPRKYYKSTELGMNVAKELEKTTNDLTETINILERDL